MIMKNWLVDARLNCPQEWQSINGILMEEADIIDENDTLLNVANYFNVNHGLKCDEHFALFFGDVFCHYVVF